MFTLLTSRILATLSNFRKQLQCSGLHVSSSIRTNWMSFNES